MALKKVLVKKSGAVVAKKSTANKIVKVGFIFLFL